jgi:hypothetical protein
MTWRRGPSRTFAIDPTTGLTYVNVPGTHQIAVVNLDARRIAAVWPMRQASGNFPMALDVPHALLASVSRSPPTLLLFDLANMPLLQTLPGCGDADDVFVDDRRQSIYIGCGVSEVAVFACTGERWTMDATQNNAHRRWRADRAVRTGSQPPVRRRAGGPVEFDGRDPRVSPGAVTGAGGDRLRVVPYSQWAGIQVQRPRPGRQAQWPGA